MQDVPIAESRRRARQKTYDPEPLRARLTELLEQNKESYREAALKSGLDHQAVRRILAGNRPQMHVCIQLADHFGINPNELLALAGWPGLKAFDLQTDSAENLPPEAVDVAKEISRIPNPGTRKTVAEAILTLVRKYFEE
jgi:transcriptional regulator with XRE-family HTH domain